MLFFPVSTVQKISYTVGSTVYRYQQLTYSYMLCIFVIWISVAHLIWYVWGSKVLLEDDSPKMAKNDCQVDPGEC